MSVSGHTSSCSFWGPILGVVVGFASATALEYLRARLKQKHERWSWYYAERAKAIKKLYSRLASAEDSLIHFVAQPKDETNRNDAQRQRQVAAAFFQCNRIFFTENECKLIEQCLDFKLDAFIGASASNSNSGYSESVRSGAESRARELVQQKIPEVRQMLEREFRKALDMAKGYGKRGSS